MPRCTSWTARALRTSSTSGICVRPAVRSFRCRSSSIARRSSRDSSPTTSKSTVFIGAMTRRFARWRTSSDLDIRRWMRCRLMPRRLSWRFPKAIRPQTASSRFSTGTLASGTNGRAIKTTPFRATPTPSLKLQSTLKTRGNSAFASSRYSQRLRTRTAFTVKGVAPMTLNSGSTEPASTLLKSFLHRPDRTLNAPFRDSVPGGTGALVGTGSSRLSPMT